MGLGIKRYIKRKFLVPRDKVLVFTFHQSSDYFNPRNHCSYTWSDSRQFEINLKFLLSNFEIVPLKQALDELKEGSVRGTKVSLTFDDGDITVKEFIIPLLEKYQVPATFFINSAYANRTKKGYWFNIYNCLSNGNIKQKSKITPEIESIFKNIRHTNDQQYYNDNYKIIEDLEEYMDDDYFQYMSLGYLKMLDPQLFTIGLHGHEHQRFSMMSKTWKRNSLISNRMNLCNLPGYIPVFAIPFGKSIDCDKETVDLCEEFGLRMAYSDNGYNINSGSAAIMRIPADGKDLNSLIMNISPNK